MDGPFLDSVDANLKNHSNHTDTNTDTHPPRPRAKSHVQESVHTTMLKLQ
jgi:hypothetical protein